MEINLNIYIMTFKFTFKFTFKIYLTPGITRLSTRAIIISHHFSVCIDIPDFYGERNIRLMKICDGLGFSKF